MALTTFNPKKINGGWNPPAGNIPMQGFMDGTFIEVEYAEDAATIHVGADGVISVVLNANRMATVTVTLVQGSDTNEQLSKNVPDARANRLPRGAFSLTDLNGTTVVSGKDAFIKKTAKIEFGKAITGRQWVFVVPEAEIFVGKGGD